MFKSLINLKIIKNFLLNELKKLYRCLLFAKPYIKRNFSVQVANEVNDQAPTKVNYNQQILLEKIFSKNPIVILNGPFIGMKYINRSNHSNLLPKIIGSYEEPIHRWILDILEQGRYTTIINVGCAEGYYAVGLVKSKSQPKVLAFDADNKALENARYLAKINDVSNSIKFFERFESSAITEILESNLCENILIFMDIEGEELNLLNTFQYPALLRCDVLVELHDCFYSGITEKLISYFSETHKIEIIVDYPYRINTYTFNGKEFSTEDILYMTDEKRPEKMRWLLAKIK
jgi:hypothetical protein